MADEQWWLLTGVADPAPSGTQRRPRLEDDADVGDFVTDPWEGSLGHDCAEDERWAEDTDARMGV